MAEYSDATLRYTIRNSLAVYIYDKDKVKRIVDNLLPPERRNIGSIPADVCSLFNDSHETPPACEEFLTRLLFDISPGRI